MSLESLIEAVKDKIGAIVQKPKMTDKLLAKPPFRFLHDTISSLTVSTGFGEGLYADVELDSAQITEKQAKINYLDKIINLVGICKGVALDVKAGKIVSGLEPENTNSFLLALAECASDSSYDNAEAVGRCLAGVLPGQGPLPRRNNARPAAAESKSEPAPVAPSKSSSNMDNNDSRSSKNVELKQADVDVAPAPERGRSRGGTRGGKPTAAQASSLDVGLGRMAAMPNLDAEIEKCDGSEATTQAMLGELITKPKLSEKLLSKPPFRFLFDIVMEIIRATGFGTSLYSDEEMDSANVSEKSQKINFLEKITKLVGLQLNTIVEAKPTKIIAGLDPQNTNHFLQLLAIAAKCVPDSSAAVRTVLDELGGGVIEALPVGASSAAPLPTRETFEAPAPMRASAEPMQEERLSRPDDKRSAVAEEKPKLLKQQSSAAPQSFSNLNISEPKEDAAAAAAPITSSRQDERREIGDDKTSYDNIGDGDGEVKRSARPTTARRRPPKVKEGAAEVLAKDVAPSSKKAEGILIDGQGDDDDDDGVVAEEKRLADEFKGAGQGQGDAQSKIVKDILSRQAEQEAAAKGSSGDSNNGNDDAKGAADEGNNKGGGGIRLGGSLKKGTDKKTTAAGAGASGAGAGAGSSSGVSSEQDMDRLRATIQLLVQHTGPLGACMDFIQEDVGLMTAELNKWEDDCRKYEAEVEVEKRKSMEVLQPLRSQLSELEEQISDQVAKITSMKASILKNDEKVQNILKAVVSA